LGIDGDVTFGHCSMVPFAAPFLTAWAREGARLVIAVDRVKFHATDLV